MGRPAIPRAQNRDLTHKLTHKLIHKLTHKLTPKLTPKLFGAANDLSLTIGAA
jgi:hypothetical protein